MEHLQYKSNNINTKSILPYIYTIVNCHKTNFVEIIKVRYNRICRLSNSPTSPISTLRSHSTPVEGMQKHTAFPGFLLRAQQGHFEVAKAVQFKFRERAQWSQCEHC